MDTLEEDNYEETPDLLSDSIIKMHNDLKNSRLYPEPKNKNSKSSFKITMDDNNANNSYSNFIADISPGNLIPYDDDDIEKKLNDLSSSSSISINNLNNISLDPNFNLLDYNYTEIQTLQDEMEAISEETNESKEKGKKLISRCSDKPSQVLFPENDGSLESLLLMLKVPPTQDVFQLIVQNAMGNDLPVSQKVFLSLENNGYSPSTTYNHLNNKTVNNQYIISDQKNSKEIISTENSNKVIIHNSSEFNHEHNTFQNYRFGNDYEANANFYFLQCQSKEDLQRLQQVQKQKRRASTDFMDLVSQVPYWVDWDKINKGQEVFWKYGLPLWISITLYAMTKGAILPLPDPLNTSCHSSDQKDNNSSKDSRDNSKKKKEQLLPSYLETSQIIIECMMSDSLRPGGVAWKSLVQIRCRHAQYRVDFVDTTFDLHDLHDYLADGIKCYEKKEQKKKSRIKENWNVNTNGDVQPYSKSEIKSDVKIIEFPYSNDNTNRNHYLLTNNSYHGNKKKQEVDEDTLEIEMMRRKTNSKNNKDKSVQDSINNNYPTPCSSPTPNQQKSKNKSFNTIDQYNNDKEIPPIQKEVMSLPLELLDSIFPINQISLAKTILYLSIGSIKAMERTFGISMTEEEQKNYLLVWRYIAWVCGLEDKRGKNYGNKIITPKYAEIAINYFLEKDPLVSWDNELVYHAKAVIKSLALSIPIIGMTSIMKTIVNEVSRKFTYFTSIPIPKEMNYSVMVNLPNNNDKIYSIPLFSYLVHLLFSTKKKIDSESENNNSLKNNDKQYNKNNGHSSKEKSKRREVSSSSISISTQKYTRYKKKAEKNMNIIHGQKSYIASGIASIFLVFIRFINNIFGFTDVGVYLMNKINQTLIPKLIWIANNYQWVDFSRRKLNS